jgi:16S rRNA (adenine1518-N6/adenine1519-N6)-dimethyltransferase
LQITNRQLQIQFSLKPERKRVNVPKGATVQTSSRKPKLGQHFLASEAAALRIVEALGDVSQATVLEIGPGRGAITDLAGTEGAATDRRRIGPRPFRAAPDEIQHATECGNHRRRHSDGGTGHRLRAKPGSLHTGLSFAPEPARVVGNLPYYITSDILLRLFEYHRYFSTIVIMVQKEVADRLAASAGSRDYGLLSATAQLYGRSRATFHACRQRRLSPPPKVHSSVVRITIKPRLERCGFRRRVHCIPETLLWAEAQNSLE